MSLTAESILYLLALLPFYLLGAFPTGVLLARSQGVNLLEVGSGNVGATNVSRALGKKAGLLTLVVDVSKGSLCTVLGLWLSGTEQFMGAAAVAAVLGHCFSVPGKFKGGKGVATALGCLAVLSPLSALSALAIFAGVFWAFRFVSLSSISAALCAPLVPLILGRDQGVVLPIALMGLILTARHWQNLQRLAAGTEPKFSSSRKT